MATPKHRCHWPGCDEAIPTALWGCRHHWSQLPQRIRRRLTAAYRPGQEEDRRVSREYIEAAKEARTWALEQAPEPAPCGKICYPTAHAAMRSSGRVGKGLRAYHCSACHAYHLTKKPPIAGFR